MEPWPLMAWGLMLTAIIKAVQSRDFTEKDIIFLHPSKLISEIPNSFITVSRTSQNPLSCVPARQCAAGDIRICSMSQWGLRERVCVCTSCCEGNICNMPLPRNETDAIFATTSPINDSIRPAQSPTLLLSVCIISLTLHSIN
uniref:Uncharacterized protein n=1 Tax=Sinocyclocheilus grahami TaxID=75366 RepID=A0A672TAY2_SINGR